jgi:hypothetical protein
MTSGDKDATADEFMTGNHLGNDCVRAITARTANIHSETIMNEGQPSAPALTGQTQNGLSITSLVLGILSILGCLFLTGIPAIITGHIAHARARRDPQTYGGASMALAGLIMGYVGTLLVTVIAVLAALLLPALAKAKARAQTIQCVNNMKQVGLAARIWSSDHKEVFPPDFISMQNELVTPKVLVCPSDKSKTVVMNWSQFDPSANVSYEFLLPGAKEADVSSQIVFRCPIHGNIGLGDGSVQRGTGR